MTKLILFIVALAASVSAQSGGTTCSASTCRTCLENSGCRWCDTGCTSWGTGSSCQIGSPGYVFVRSNCRETPEYWYTFTAICGFFMFVNLLIWIRLVGIGKQNRQEIGRTAFSTDIPAHVADLFRTANSSNSPVQWVGRQQFTTNPFWPFLGGFGIACLGFILSLTLEFEPLLALVIIPSIWSLVAAIFLQRMATTYAKTVYVLTADSCYVFAPSCCSGMFMSNSWNLSTVNPVLVNLMSSGVGGIVLGTRLVRTKHGYRTVQMGFMGIAECNKVYTHMTGLRNEWIARIPGSGQPLVVVQPTMNGMQVQLQHMSGAQGMQGMQQMVMGGHQVQVQQVQQQQSQQPMFDPYTGKPLHQVPQGALFDPYTGKPIVQHQQQEGMMSQPLLTSNSSQQPQQQQQAPPAYSGAYIPVNPEQQQSPPPYNPSS